MTMLRFLFCWHLAKTHSPHSSLMAAKLWTFHLIVNHSNFVICNLFICLQEVCCHKTLNPIFFHRSPQPCSHYFSHRKCFDHRASLQLPFHILCYPHHKHASCNKRLKCEQNKCWVNQKLPSHHLFLQSSSTLIFGGRITVADKTKQNKTKTFPVSKKVDDLMPFRKVCPPFCQLPSKQAVWWTVFLILCYSFSSCF